MTTIEDRVRVEIEAFDTLLEENPDIFDDEDVAQSCQARAYQIICDLLEEHSPDCLDLEKLTEPGADDLSTMDLVVREIRRLQALDKMAENVST